MKKIYSLLTLGLLVGAAVSVDAQSYVPKRHVITVDNTPPTFEPGDMPTGIVVSDTLVFKAIGDADGPVHTLTFSESPTGTVAIEGKISPGGVDSVFKYVVRNIGDFEVVSDRLATSAFNFTAGATPSGQYRRHVITADDSPLNGTFNPGALPTGVITGDTLVFKAVGDPDDVHTLSFTEQPTGTVQISGVIAPAGNDSVIKYVPTTPGRYVVSSSMTGSTNFTVDVAGPVITSNEDAVAYDGISFFPNPAREVMNVTLNPTYSYVVSVTDMVGTTFSTKSVSNANNTTIDVNGLSKGAYILHLSSEGAQPKAFKFIKE